MKAVRYFICLLGLLLLFGFTIFMMEGMQGFFPIFNEGLVIIIIGTVFIVMMTFSIREARTSFSCALNKKQEFSGEQLTCARQFFSALSNTSLAVGCIIAVLAAIFMLRTIDDAAQVPKRIAMVLVPLLWGLFFAEGVFAPLKRNVEKRVLASEKSGSGERGRILLGMLCFFIIMFCAVSILYAISAVLTGL